MRTKIAVLLSVALSLAAAGVFLLWLFSKPARDGLVRFVPRDAVTYVHLYLEPSTQQRVAIRDLLGRLPLDAADAEELKEALGRLLDPALAVSGMTYVRDISPWLGDQMAFYALPEGLGEAVLLTVGRGREDQAIRAANRVAASQREISAEILGDVLVVGAVDAVEAVAETHRGAQTLASYGPYREVVAPLPVDRTLTLYAMSEQGEPNLAVSAAGVARSDGVAFDLIVPGSEPPEISPGGLSEMIGRLDEAEVLPFDRFGDLLMRIEEGGPLVVAALRAAGVLREGEDSFDRMLGDGFASSLVVDAGRMEELSGTLTVGAEEDGPMEWARYISHIVLGTHANGTIRIVIGVK